MAIWTQKISCRISSIRRRLCVNSRHPDASLREDEMNINQLDTPAAVVDLDRLETNITRLQSYLDQHGIRNRPHIKTHKIPAIAHMQIAAGAVGIACQKIGEAEVMAAAGITDILIPFNIIGEAKLTRLM